MTLAPIRGALTLSVITLFKSMSYLAEAFSSTKDSGVDLPELSLKLGLHIQLTKGPLTFLMCRKNASKERSSSLASWVVDTQDSCSLYPAATYFCLDYLELTSPI